MTLRLLLAVLLVATGAVARAADPLRPEQAFRYAASVEGSDVVVRWTIEPGYYLYRERMSYATKTAGAELGTPVMPEGLPYKDEFFGDMHIYRESAVVRIPIVKLPPDARLDLDIRSQGCADIGLCYPPQNWTTTVMGPANATPTATAPGKSLAGLLRRQDPNAPLPPEKVFHVSA